MQSAFRRPGCASICDVCPFCRPRTRTYDGELLTSRRHRARYIGYIGPAPDLPRPRTCPGPGPGPAPAPAPALPCPAPALPCPALPPALPRLPPCPGPCPARPAPVPARPAPPSALPRQAFRAGLGAIIASLRIFDPHCRIVRHGAPSDVNVTHRAQLHRPAHARSHATRAVSARSDHAFMGSAHHALPTSRSRTMRGASPDRTSGMRGGRRPPGPGMKSPRARLYVRDADLAVRIRRDAGG